MESLALSGGKCHEYLVFSQVACAANTHIYFTPWKRMLVADSFFAPAAAALGFFYEALKGHANLANLSEGMIIISFFLGFF